MRLSATALAAAVAVAGCTPANVAKFYSPAGAELDERGTTRSAPEANLAVMTGERAAAIDLSRRFADAAPTTINFAFDSAVLAPEARAKLDEQIAFIRGHPNAVFRVYGHTDKVGTQAYNKTLGLRRAQAVVAYFVAKGLSRDRLEAVASFGETQPLVVTGGRERRNRRTVTEVSGFVNGRPQTLDGKYAARIYEEYIESAAEPHEAVGGGEDAAATAP